MSDVQEDMRLIVKAFDDATRRLAAAMEGLTDALRDLEIPQENVQRRSSNRRSKS